MSRIIGNTVGTTLNPKKVAEMVDVNYSLVANVLRGQKSGNPIRIDDASPLPHTMTILSETEFDLKKYGKNLLQLPYQMKDTTQSNLTFTVQEDGSILVECEPTYDDEGNESYIVSANVYYVFGQCELGNNVGINANENGATNGIYAVSRRMQWNYGNKNLTLFFPSGYDMGAYETWWYPQLEVGTISTEWEAPKEPETISLTDGVDGYYVEIPIESTDVISFVADDEAQITAHYNRDINKAFAEIQTAIATMGAAASVIPEEV